MGRRITFRSISRKRMVSDKRRNGEGVIICRCGANLWYGVKPYWEMRFRCSKCDLVVHHEYFVEDRDKVRNVLDES